jgi:4-hydroxybenzoate polyprenyltransferase
MATSCNPENPVPKSNQTHDTHVKRWLQLLRAPNLFTVPGDPLAGFLVACGFAQNGIAVLDGRAIYAVFASLCLYSAGLVGNDIFDIAEDRRDRPHRPLASGAISLQSAWITTVILSGVGILLMTIAAERAGLLVSSLLLGSIGLYNAVTKRIPFIGAVNMGVCRGLSLLLGATAFTNSLQLHPFIILCASILGAYIAAVTNLARYETRESSPPFARILPGLALLIAFLLFSAGHGPIIQTFATTLLAVSLVFTSAEIGRLFRKDAPPLPPVIGALIRVLLPIQAAFCLVFSRTNDAIFTALALLLAMPVSRIVAQKFYAS